MPSAAIDSPIWLSPAERSSITRWVIWVVHVRADCDDSNQTRRFTINLPGRSDAATWGEMDMTKTIGTCRSSQRASPIKRSTCNSRGVSLNSLPWKRVHSTFCLILFIRPGSARGSGQSRSGTESKCSQHRFTKICLAYKCHSSGNRDATTAGETGSTV
jgi:hypothetical protein